MNKLVQILCQKIGIENLAELNRFFKEEKQPGENLVDCLMRYYLELGGSKFKIIG